MEPSAAGTRAVARGSIATMTAVIADDLAPLRRRLVAFCYHMLGSPFDAEDAVQEVMERAWRSRESFDASRGSLSTWCYRIAHNVCVDRLRDAVRRSLPRDLQDPGIEVGAPLVPAPDVPWLMPAPSAWFGESEPAAAAERAADVRLAVTAMLQALPPRQRGVFVLREVMGYSASETAEVLESSVPAVNSALQRARTGIGGGPARPCPLQADRVERYARAIEQADVDALVALVSDDVVLEMPPVPAWSRGRQQYRDFMVHLFSWRGTSWVTHPVDSNGQPAILLYQLTSEGPVPHTLQLFDGDSSGAISHVLVYHEPRLFSLFEASAVR
jgi:RNA polymerase sigma-70 factor (ECF subfamily)